MEYTSPPPREEDRGFEGGGLNPINPWAALWRDRGLLVIALVGLALLAAIAVTALTPERNLLREVTLKSERGLTDFGEVPSLSRGERFRLELNLPKPASILVFLEDPQGALSRVHPPPARKRSSRDRGSGCHPTERRGRPAGARKDGTGTPCGCSPLPGPSAPGRTRLSRSLSRSPPPGIARRAARSSGTSGSGGTSRR